MSASHQRSASATERRSVVNGFHSRSASTQARNYEKPIPQDRASPVHSGSEVADSIKRPRVTERRREQTVITTTETLMRRSPKKEVRMNANKSLQEWQRKTAPNVSSTATEKEMSTQAGMYCGWNGCEARIMADEETVPWAPIASLNLHSSAPLACRISAPPASRDAPDVLQPMSLSGVSVHEQEQLILDDLLYVFMGYEGHYIRFADNYEPAEEKDRLSGPSFKPPHGIDPTLRDLTNAMLQMARDYSAMVSFIEVQSKEEYGSVNHALCAAIRKILKDYLILITQLESKLVNDTNFTLHQMHLSLIPTAQSLSQLYTVAQDLLKKNALLEEDLDDSLDDFDTDNIIERLREGGDLLPGSMMKNRCIGGNVLALLTQRLATYSGDPAARSILEMLLREASRPYMHMLNEWLHHGGIKDPYSEFLVGERTSIKRAGLDEDYTNQYWEKRYYIREKDVPPQLESVKEKVILAGKYLNVVRECGGVNVTASITNTPTSFDDPQFLDNVNNAYSFANSELLKLLLTKNSLRNRLRSMKHYFFLNQADFFLYFLELSGSELRKPQKSVNVTKLQSLLDLVLYQPGSIAVTDPFKEDVKVKMNEIGLTQWLMKIVNVQGADQDNPASLVEQYKNPTATTAKDGDKDIIGFDALELDYRVPFPLSLIISRKTVLRYQLIFRYILSLRHLESSLINSWSEHDKAYSWTHKSSNRQLEIWKRRVWTLRSRMLVFVQQMLFYTTAEVIEPNWQKLMTKVDTAEAFQRGEEDDLPLHRRSRRTVDELIQDHLDMLDSCIKDLGLTQGKLLRIYSKLMNGCTMFANYTSNLTRYLYEADTDFEFLHSQPDSKRAEKVTANFRQFSNSAVPKPNPNRITQLEDALIKHEEYFNRHLKILIDSLNYFAATETVALLSLCARLTNAEVQKRDDTFV